MGFMGNHLVLDFLRRNAKYTLHDFGIYRSYINASRQVTGFKKMLRLKSSPVSVHLGLVNQTSG